MIKQHTEPAPALSLVKSRQTLDRLHNRLNQLEPTRSSQQLVQSLLNSSQQIALTLDSHIDSNFHTLLHAPSLMPLPPQPTPAHKENTTPTLSSMEGARALMHHYWERARPSSNKGKLSRTALPREKKEQKLPQINSSFSEMKLAGFIKGKEREKELLVGCKEERAFEDYHIRIDFVDYKCQNDSPQFLKFQRVYYKRWAEISSLLRAMEKFARLYQLSPLSAHSQRVLELIEAIRQGRKTEAHTMLACFDDPEGISQLNPTKPGIRFYGPTGKTRAAVRLQARVRAWLQRGRFLRQVEQWRAAAKIQGQFRCHLMHLRLKQRIVQGQLGKLEWFKASQAQFRSSFRRKEQSSAVRYEIHIASHCWSQWQKLSTDHYLQLQSSQLCRIFKAACPSDSPTQTHVVYVSPVEISPDILNYYRKLFEVASGASLEGRVTLLTPRSSPSLPVNLSLSQHLYYCSHTLRRIRRMVREQFAYIVPATPSQDHLQLSHCLGLPLYSGPPQVLRYLETVAGCKTLQDGLKSEEEEGFGVLPYSVDIYNEFSLLNELTNLIYRYPLTPRWVLKIDNEVQSRGIAHIDTRKILGRGMLEALSQGRPQQEKATRTQIYSALEASLILNREERVIPLRKDVYPSQQEYLNYFYTRGGVIEAAVGNFEGELDKYCFTVDLQPDGEWRLVTSFSKVAYRKRTVGAYYSPQPAPLPPQANSIIAQLKQQGLFGYFTLEFISSAPPKESTSLKDTSAGATGPRVAYFNRIECHLSLYACAHYLRELMAPSSCALFLPVVPHPLLGQLRLQTFFHLCRLENISFDIQKREGNVFAFVDSLESGCVGMLTFHPSSREQCLGHCAGALSFFSSKLKQPGNRPASGLFHAITNAVKGHLNRLDRLQLKSAKKLASTPHL